MAVGDHKNITYVQVRRRRPPNLGCSSHERLDRWCLDWSFENFQIYTVPGKFNFFNDFHSRQGAPKSSPFMTLEEHARRIDVEEGELW